MAGLSPMVTPDSLPSPVQAYFDEMILSTPVANYPHSACAVMKNLPQNAGPKIRMRRYNPLGSAIVPLGNDGIEPAPVDFTGVDIDAEPQLYGMWLRIHESVTLTNSDPVMNNAAKRLGDALRKTEDELVKKCLLSSATTVFCTNGGNGRFPATELNRIDIDEVTTLLLGNNGMMISEGMPGADMFATSPVRDAYFAFAHTDLCGSRGLGQVEGFLSKNAYPSSKNESKYSEWGAVANARFLVSSVAAKEINGAGVGVDMYTIPFVAQESYASVKLAGYASQFVYRPAHLNGALALFSTLGFKMRHASAILNDQWVALLKCTLA